MIQLCHFVDDGGQLRCDRCQRPLRSGAPLSTRRHCKATCTHLGPPIERDGITVQVKCTCPNNEKGYTEQWHTAHHCAVFGRCLPTFRGPWQEGHETEAAIYHLCQSDQGLCERFKAKS